MSPAVLDRWQAEFDARERASGEPSWLATYREQALSRLRTLGFPTRRDEAWRTLDLAPIVRTAWSAAPRADDALLDRARALLRAEDAEVGSLLVLVNGRFAPELSDTGSLPRGVRLATLGESAGDLEGGLGAPLDATDHPFAALNGALFADALRIDVTEGAPESGAIHVVSLSLGDGEARAAHPRFVLDVGQGARAAVAWTWRGESDAPFFSNAVGEIRVGDAARLEWLDVQALPPSVHHLVRLNVEVGRDATFAGACAQLGAGLVRMDLDARLAEPGAFCRLDGVSLLGRKQHVDVRTNLDHAVPHGSSDQLWKSILDDRASAAFSGRVLVRPGAQRTDAKQANHSLLLSKHAVADSVPQLEIFADDVKCAHGATVGQMDEEALFYLRSRGIGLEDARSMLVRAFANDVADRVEAESLSRYAHAVLDAGLDGKGDR